MKENHLIFILIFGTILTFSILLYSKPFESNVYTPNDDYLSKIPYEIILKDKNDYSKQRYEDNGIYISDEKYLVSKNILIIRTDSKGLNHIKKDKNVISYKELLSEM